MDELKHIPTDPQDGTLKKRRPACRVEDHKWIINLEAGCIHLACADPHTQEECEEMDDFPSCDHGPESELIVADFGPLDLKWHKESHGWEYPRDFDYWLEIDPDRNLSQAQRALYAGLPAFVNLEEMIKSEYSENQLLALVRSMRKIFEKGLDEPKPQENYPVRHEHESYNEFERLGQIDRANRLGRLGKYK
jgi:hypothetical protein